jgi:hypothetical protein
MFGLESGTMSIDWAQLSRFHLKMETEFSLKNVMCYFKLNRIMDIIQKQNNCNSSFVRSSSIDICHTIWYQH